MNRCLMAAMLVAGVGAWTVAAGETNTPPRPPPAKRAVRTGLHDPMAIRLPDMNFRQTPVPEIVDWIRDRSLENDPAGIGANLLLKDPVGKLARTRLTVVLTTPTVRRALDLLSSTANLYVRQDQRVIVVEPSAQPEVR